MFRWPTVYEYHSADLHLTNLRDMARYNPDMDYSEELAQAEKERYDAALEYRKACEEVGKVLPESARKDIEEYEKKHS